MLIDDKVIFDFSKNRSQYSSIRDINCQTAGSLMNFTIKDIPNSNQNFVLKMASSNKSPSQWGIRNIDIIVAYVDSSPNTCNPSCNCPSSTDATCISCVDENA